MTQLASQHTNLMPEHYVFSLSRRPDDNTSQQSPDDRLQDSEHRRWIVA
jgi:hypothetical protein